MQVFLQAATSHLLSARIGLLQKLVILTQYKLIEGMHAASTVENTCGAISASNKIICVLFWPNRDR